MTFMTTLTVTLVLYVHRQETAALTERFIITVNVVQNEHISFTGPYFLSPISCLTTNAEPDSEHEELS